MSARMLFLDSKGSEAGQAEQRLAVQIPPKKQRCGAGPFVVCETVDGVPNIGQLGMGA